MVVVCDCELSICQNDSRQDAFATWKNSSLTGFFNIPKIFEGSYRDTSDKFGCIDFVGTQFSTVEVEGDRDEGFPFQHSGESVGHASSFQLKSSGNPSSL